MSKASRGKRRGEAVQLGALAPDLVEPALARQGLGETSLVTDWSEIAGARIAGTCRPIEVQWPRANRRDPDAPPGLATLVLRVEGAFALEAQHSTAVIIERVNAHLGWRCIGRIAFRQGPLDRATNRAPKSTPTPGPQAREKAEQHVSTIEAGDLRDALARWGAWVIDRTGRER